MRQRWTHAAAGLLAVVLAAATVARAADPAQPAGAAQGQVEAAGGAHGDDHGAEPALIAEPSAGIVPAVTTLVIFALLLAVLGKYAWGPIVAGLRQREEKIRKDIADAEESRRRSEAALREYEAKLADAENRVRELIETGRAEAERMATGIKMQAQQDVEEIKERAERDIESARAQAISGIYAEAADLSTAIAEKILRRNLNADDQRDLVNQSLEQLQAVGKA
jgi:F-type H+-transporting ATPase subunit b